MDEVRAGKIILNNCILSGLQKVCMLQANNCMLREREKEE